MPALADHHATLFVPPDVSEPFERLRRRWDPEMARQIPAHVTLVYPREIDDPNVLVERVRSAAAASSPLHFRVAGLVADRDDPTQGVYFVLDDSDGGWSALRSRLPVPRYGPAREPVPHVTIVHPRTSDLGPQAWRCRDEWASEPVGLELTVREVAITAFDGEGWPAIERFALTSS
jgi:2'-5' RNA ligase